MKWPFTIDLATYCRFLPTYVVISGAVFFIVAGLTFWYAEDVRWYHIAAIAVAFVLADAGYKLGVRCPSCGERPCASIYSIKPTCRHCGFDAKQ